MRIKHLHNLTISQTVNHIIVCHGAARTYAITTILYIIRLIDDADERPRYCAHLLYIPV